MNTVQQRYLKERLGVIKRSRLAALQEQHRGTSLSDAEMRKALKGGDFSVRSPLPKGRMYYLRDALVFAGEVAADAKGLARATAALEKEYVQLVDRIMLGDEDQALAALNAFAEGK